MWYEDGSSAQKGERIENYLDGITTLKKTIIAATDFLGKNLLDWKFDEDTARQLKQAYTGFKEDDTKPARHKYYAKMAGMETWLSAQPDLDLTPVDDTFMEDCVPLIHSLIRNASYLSRVSGESIIDNVGASLKEVADKLVTAINCKPDRDKVLPYLEQAINRLNSAGTAIYEIEQEALKDFANEDSQHCLQAYKMQKKAENEQKLKEESDARRAVRNIQIQKGREQGYLWYDDSPIVKYPRN